MPSMTHARIWGARSLRVSYRGTTVTCPCHGSQFDVTSGAVIRGPAQRAVRARSVEVEGEELLVES